MENIYHTIYIYIYIYELQKDLFLNNYNGKIQKDKCRMTIKK